jgi:integrase
MQPASSTPYRGCSLTTDRRGNLRLRYRWKGRHRSVALNVADTPASRATWLPLIEVVGRVVRAGRDPAAVLRETIKNPEPAADVAAERLRDFAARWLDAQSPDIRPAQARDYRRHLRRYILPRLGRLPLANLTRADVKGFQVELLKVGPPVAPMPKRGTPSKQQPLKPKTVKNIISGTLRAMLKDARRDGLLSHEQFASILDLDWPKVRVPDPDPLARDELAAIEAKLAATTFKRRSGARVVWPSYPGLVHLLAWTGMRPSEAAGLQWQDVDLKRGILHVRRSRHLHTDGDPKTKQARRTVQLAPATVGVLRALCPLHVEPTAYVFLNTDGEPIEPNNFGPHWHDALRACGIRVRGLYSLKDSFVSGALSADPPAPITWLEEQTGVAYATLRRHYAKWWPTADAGSPFDHFGPSDCASSPKSGGTKSRMLRKAGQLRSAKGGT